VIKLVIRHPRKEEQDIFQEGRYRSHGSMDMALEGRDEGESLSVRE